MRTIIAVVTLVAAAALAGCASPGTSPSTTTVTRVTTVTPTPTIQYTETEREARYIAALDAAALSSPLPSPSDALGLGRLVCAHPGLDEVDVAGAIQGPYAMSRSDALVVVRAAKKMLCPVID